MNKLSEYVVRGVMGECPETFVKRVAILLERTGMLDLLAEGVPVSADIMDNGALFCMQKKDREVISIDYTHVSINAESQISVPYAYKGDDVYVRNEKDAERYSKGDYVESKRESNKEFSVPTSRILKSDSTIPLEKADDYGIEVHYI